ncbi:hypothetical protein [Serinicoccus kebangsaanensis]|uniref:hypothetical protein n=1 Tax=Serinicoccus kebangsaanensis TaxID=2602069 RepID=UPI00178C530A|nr:hypothetical protein [Serinicoccus kebangsaanensis]
MQRGKQVPWFGIIVAVILLNVFTSIDLPVVPIIVAAVVFSMVTGSRRARSVGGSTAQGRQTPAAPDPPAGDTEQGLPRIDVPQFPGDAPPPPLPTQGTQPAAEPHRLEPEPAPRPEPASAGGAAAYPSSTSTDPVVSLGQLHLGRLARELSAAAGTGASADVDRLLGEIDDMTQRSLMMLDGATGMPGSGRREFESGLRRLEREVRAARGEQPAGSRVDRVVRTCTSLGQTGRYA